MSLPGALDPRLARATVFPLRRSPSFFRLALPAAAEVATERIVFSMARFLPTAAITDVRGSIAGTCFKLGRSGPVVCRKPSSRRQRRLAQTERTASLSSLNARWKNTLTGDQRAAWNSIAAALGQPSQTRTLRTLSGLQLYLSENLVRATATLSPVDDAPATPNFLPTPDVSNGFVSSLFVFYAPAGDLPASGEWYLASLSVLTSPSANHPPKWWRQHWLLTGPLSTLQLLSIDAPLQAGGTFWIRTVLISDAGIHSAPHLFQGVL